jgi:hypothetical protein
MKYILLLLVFTAAASGGDLLKIKNDFKEIKLKLYNNELPSGELIISLQKEIESIEPEAGIISEKLDLYLRLAAEKIKPDILLSVVNEASDEFYKSYGEEIYNKIKAEEKTRFILFTTSISCECTILMCRDYEKALYRTLERTGDSEFVIIDTYSNNSLTDKFNISFVPVLIILDKEGTETRRYIREENISEILNNYLSKGGI